MATSISTDANGQLFNATPKWQNDTAWLSQSYVSLRDRRNVRPLKAAPAVGAPSDVLQPQARGAVAIAKTTRDTKRSTRTGRGTSTSGMSDCRETAQRRCRSNPSNTALAFLYTRKCFCTRAGSIFVFGIFLLLRHPPHTVFIHNHYLTAQQYATPAQPQARAASWTSLRHALPTSTSCILYSVRCSYCCKVTPSEQTFKQQTANSIFKSSLRVCATAAVEYTRPTHRHQLNSDRHQQPHQEQHRPHHVPNEPRAPAAHHSPRHRSSV